MHETPKIENPSDYFALLEEPRRPWIDLALLQGKFLALSAELHPDRVHSTSLEEQTAATARFSALNAAYGCLRNPALRLRHLVELETGLPPTNLERLPGTSSDFYFTAGQICRSADEVIKNKSAVTSPLLQAQAYERAMEWVDKLQELQSALEMKRLQLEVSLQNLNPVWAAAPPPGSDDRKASLPLRQLEELYREISFANRWSEQIRQRLFELAL